jgi:hypothetical protein
MEFVDIHRIRAYDIKVFQKGHGGLAPRLELMMGRERAGELRAQRAASAQRVYNRVQAERAEAAARGVHVVVDDTKPDSYVKVRFYD